MIGLTIQPYKDTTIYTHNDINGNIAQDDRQLLTDNTISTTIVYLIKGNFGIRKGCNHTNSYTITDIGALIRGSTLVFHFINLFNCNRKYHQIITFI